MQKGTRRIYISVVTVPVKDVDRAIEFYTKKLGWEKTMDAPMSEGRWVTVTPPGGQTAFTLSHHSEGWSNKSDGFSGVIIEVGDLEKTYEQLRQVGVEFPEGPRSEPWGGWAMFKDSEGNVHGLHSSIPARE